MTLSSSRFIMKKTQQSSAHKIIIFRRYECNLLPRRLYCVASKIRAHVYELRIVLLRDLQPSFLFSCMCCISRIYVRVCLRKTKRGFYCCQFPGSNYQRQISLILGCMSFGKYFTYQSSSKKGTDTKRAPILTNQAPSTP